MKTACSTICVKLIYYGPTKQGILYETTNSLMSIKTSDYESLDGTNAHYNIFDEVHTYDDDFIKVVNDGSSRKRKNWITWYISTNGTKT